jgi:hypothetical protein
MLFLGSIVVEWTEHATTKGRGQRNRKIGAGWFRDSTEAITIEQR